MKIIENNKGLRISLVFISYITVKEISIILGNQKEYSTGLISTLLKIQEMLKYMRIIA